MFHLIAFSLLLVAGAIAKDEIETTQFVNLEELVKSDSAKTECQYVDPTEVKFNFYTRNLAYTPEVIFINDHGESVHSSFYNVKKPTKFLIHGWLETSFNETMQMVQDYLYSRDVNVILVDWSAMKKCNFESTRNVVVPTVAKAMTRIMRILIAHGSTAEDNFHVVAFGMGAHIAAQAAKKLQPVKLKRISALDPIGYKFNEPGRPILENSDALFVDVMYTSIPVIAADREVGHINYYPNGGLYPQPDSADEISSSLKSIQLWRESILRPIKAWKCDSWIKYKTGGCHQTYQYMGEHVSQKVHGKFFVNTSERSEESRSLH